MDSFQEIKKCPICSEEIEYTGYKSQGGDWIGGCRCSTCRYSWTSRDSNRLSVMRSLRRGGDWGNYRLFGNSHKISWGKPRKKGVIVSLIQPGVSAKDILREISGEEKVLKWQCRLGDLSHHRRYLVRVERTGKKGQQLKPFFYAPMAHVLEDLDHNRLRIV